MKFSLINKFSAQKCSVLVFSLVSKCINWGVCVWQWAGVVPTCDKIRSPAAACSASTMRVIQVVAQTGDIIVALVTTWGAGARTPDLFSTSRLEPTRMSLYCRGPKTVGAHSHGEVGVARSLTRACTRERERRAYTRPAISTGCSQLMRPKSKCCRRRWLLRKRQRAARYNSPLPPPRGMLE